jgi:hypothetical protein
MTHDSAQLCHMRAAQVAAQWRKFMQRSYRQAEVLHSQLQTVAQTVMV